MKKLAIVSTLALSFAVSAPAAAFKIKETSKGAQVRWSRHLLPVVVAECGDAAKDALLLRAVRGAAREWSKSSNVVVDIRIAKKSEGAAIAFDPERTNESVIKWAEGDWSFDPGTLALTFLRYDVGSGQVFDADILLNDVHYSWADKMAQGGDVDTYDLQNTITHEFGHALGLAHSEMQEATMFAATEPTDVMKRFLEDDDVTAAQTLYGHPTADGNLAAPLAPPEYGCSTSGRGTTNPALILFLLAGAVLASRRRHLTRALATLSMLTLFVAPASAANFAKKDIALGAVVARADAIAQGTVVAQHIEARDNGFLVTVSTVRVDRCVAGGCPELMVIEQLGGEKDGIGFSVEGITPLRMASKLIVAARAEGARWKMVNMDAGNLLDVRHAPNTVVAQFTQSIERAWQARLQRR